MTNWRIPDDLPSEEFLCREIEYFEQRIAESEGPDTYLDQCMAVVYRAQLWHRKKLLSAMRDGRPEAWEEYPADC